MFVKGLYGLEVGWFIWEGCAKEKGGGYGNVFGVVRVFWEVDVRRGRNV